MRTIVLCNSDVLALPLLNHLYQSEKLVAVGFPEENAQRLSNALNPYRLEGERLKVFKRSTMEEDLSDWLDHLDADLLLTLTFPWKLPSVFSSLTYGAFNFHFGSLPQYAGADPIFWQLKNGEKFGSLTVHEISENIDAGRILHVDQLPIVPGTNYGYLAEGLASLAINSFTQIKKKLEEGFKLEEQSKEGSDFLKQPTYEDLRIDWNSQSADEIENLVNASNPKYNGAIATIRNMPIHLLEVSPADYSGEVGSEVIPGEVVYADFIYGLIVYTCNQKFLKISIALLSGGYYSGSKLKALGFKKGDKFT